MAERKEKQLSKIQITDDWNPNDEDAAVQRAIFFCHSLNGHLRQNLMLLVERCDAGEFGADVHADIEEWVFEEVVKEVTSTCIHLVGLDQGGANAPPWLINFLFESQQEADSICPEPPAMEVIEYRGMMAPVEMLENLDESVSSLLKISEVPAARLWLMDFFKFSRHFTNELLALCLSQPLESLSKHLRMYSD